jgi:hypothetical protein
MTCENLVAGCFGGHVTPFGDRALDRDCALKYLLCCHQARLSWKEVEGQIRAYLKMKGSHSDFIEQQVERGRNLFQAWLE